MGPKAPLRCFFTRTARCKPDLRCVLLLLVVAFAACAHRHSAASRSFEVVRRFAAPEAGQGIAVDATHFYAIDDRRIGKYDKLTGQRIRHWAAGNDDSIIHLNSGVIIDGKLYCAHSNYPAVPMVSSIEVFDAQSLEHIGTRPLTNAVGSATWVQRVDDTWWVAFANYDGRGGQTGRGPSATTLMRYDRSWRAETSYTFPPEVIDRFGSRSNSGGSWRNGLIYATGHDAPEIYLLELPAMGRELRLVEIVPAPVAGQGIAWDATEPGMLYGIIKKAREVVVLREVLSF